jgi:hypothetical protein
LSFLPAGLVGGEGVRGAEKGWAAEVDVAAGGVCVDVDEAGEMGVEL